MPCSINFIKNNKRICLELNPDEIKKVLCFKTQIETEDAINTISVAEKQIIVCTYLPKSAVGKPFWLDEPIENNNINAYDFNGNFLWNISDIVGKTHWYFYGGCIHSKTTLCQEYSIDVSLDINENHEFFTCSTEGRTYVIDLNEKKVIYQLNSK